ncbi:MAG: hypothetical protein PHE27_06315 [Alphaproteobacteria bacterium]|nr:hypothetical protein [Alphaproteobacteria bacterium]
MLEGITDFKEVKKDWDAIEKIAPVEAHIIKMSGLAIWAGLSATAINVGICLLTDVPEKPVASAVCFAFSTACSYVCLRSHANRATEKVMAHRLKHFQP